MRRFELVDGTSSKFWEIEQSGNDFTARWGKLGTTGQSATKHWDSPARCQREHDKLVTEKLKKGYVEVTASAASSTVAAVASAVSTSATAASEALATEVSTATRPASEASVTAPPTPTTDPTTSAAGAVPSAPGPAPASPSAPIAPPQLAEEDQVFWDEALRKRIYPRRGGELTTIKPLARAEKSLEQVKLGAITRAHAMLELRRKHPELATTYERIDKSALDAGSVTEDAALFTFFEWKPNYLGDPVVEPWIEYLVATRGLAHAVSVAIVGIEWCIWDEQSTVGFSIGVQPKIARTSRPFWTTEPGPHARLRGLLVAASDADYLAARAAAAEAWGEATPRQRAAIAFMFPARRGQASDEIEAVWSRETVDALRYRRGHELAVGSIADPALLDGLAAVVRHGIFGYSAAASAPDLMTTVVDGTGCAAASFVAELRDVVKYSNEHRRDWATVAAAIGDDATVRALTETLDRKESQAALALAIGRQPRRVARWIAPLAAVRGKAGDTPRELLGMVARRFPAVVPGVLRGLDPAAARALEIARDAAGPQIPEAPREALPACFADPPWKRPRPSARKVRDGMLTVALPEVMRWEAGERDAWLRSRGTSPATGRVDQLGPYDTAGWDLKLRDVDRRGTARRFLRPIEFAWAPPALARERGLVHACIARDFTRQQYYPAIAANLELDALPALLAAGTEEDDPDVLLPTLVPFGAARLAPRMAAALARSRERRVTALRWLARHPAEATAGLLPQALGGSGRARAEADAALRWLATHGHRETLVATAARASAAVCADLEALLDTDPLTLLPTKLPRVPDFADAAALPRPLLRDGRGAFDLTATEALVMMLALSSFEEPYGGLAIAREACEPASLARFAWGLFSAWVTAGTPAKEIWALQALGHFGDDACARKLAAMVREWPGEGGHARAVHGLDTLAEIGTDVALMHLNGIAEKSKFKALQGRAREKIAEIAKTRGLSAEALADRLAPDLGLDDDGSLLLDFGPRQFRVGFDEQLRPFVNDAAGGRLKDLPKPGKDDDTARAEAASERWKALKKDARTAASVQILRMELAMCAMRRWSAEVFAQVFVEHPLLVHVVRRLVWGVYDRAGALVATFRVAEDRSYADERDGSYALAPDAIVGIPHPLQIACQPGRSAAWSQIFADYEIVQPFAQLGRPTFAPDASETGALELRRVEGKKVPTGRVLGLETRGWHRGPPEDGGVVNWMEKHLESGLTVELALTPGLYTGMLSESPEQTLGRVLVRRGGAMGWGTQGAVKLGELDPVAFSEVARDLTDVVG